MNAITEVRHLQDKLDHLLAAGREAEAKIINALGPAYREPIGDVALAIYIKTGMPPMVRFVPHEEVACLADEAESRGRLMRCVDDNGSIIHTLVDPS